MRKHRRHSRRRTKRKAIGGIVLLVVIIVGGVLLASTLESMLYPTQEDINPMSRSSQRVQIDDQWYMPKENLQTTLIIGVDQYELQADSESNRNDAMADFLTLLVQDLTNNSVTVVPLNRDTMTSIPVIGINGRTAGVIEAQLAVAYSYGSGSADSALNTVQAVENLLGDHVTIDHYIVTSMDGIATLNDMVGGVPVKIDDDLSAVDPSLVEGKTILLQGEQAVSYVRSRMDVADGSNLNRMTRQETYMKSWVSQWQLNGFDEDILTNFLEDILTDYSVTQLQDMSKQINEETAVELISLSGISQVEDTFTEFTVDEAQVENMVLSLFCEKEL